jgi:hypothetical protein
VCRRRRTPLDAIVADVGPRSLRGSWSNSAWDHVMRAMRRATLLPPAAQRRPDRSRIRPDVDMRLLRRLDAATADPTRDAMAALRAAVTDFVDRRKRLGASLDDVLAAVEGMLCVHGVPRGAITGYGTAVTDRGAPVAARLLAWCVGAYRDEDWW